MSVSYSHNSLQSVRQGEACVICYERSKLWLAVLVVLKELSVIISNAVLIGCVVLAPTIKRLPRSREWLI